MNLYLALVTLHLLAAMLWLGGMLFLAVVGAPVLRALEPAIRQEIFRRLGERFRTVGWIALGVLVATGTGMVQLRGWLRPEVMGSSGFWTAGPGRTLALKLALVALMLGLSAWHDFVLGPRAGRAEPGSPRALRLRKRAAGMARVNALVGLLVLFLAARLVRGG